MTDVDITIRRRNRPAAAGKHRRGPITQPTQPRYGPRRLQGGAFIKFYDLGYLTETNSTRSTGVARGDIPTSLEDLRTFFNTVLTDPVQEWPTRYKQIVNSDPSYKLELTLTRDGNLINSGQERLFEPTNSRWMPNGYRFTETFNGIGVLDSAFLLHPFFTGQDIFTQIVTQEPDPTSSVIYLPDISPTDGDVDIFINADVLEFVVDEQRPEPTLGPPSSVEESGYPNSYGLVAGCPGQPHIDLIPEWEVAMVSYREFTQSASTDRAASVYAATVDRQAAVANALPNDPEAWENTYQKLNYLCQCLDVDYRKISYAAEGRFYNIFPKTYGDGFYINRNWLCYNGAVIGPLSNGVINNFRLNSSESESDDPTLPFAFTEANSLGSINRGLAGLVPFNSTTMDGAALLAAIRQGVNVYYIWRAFRFIET